MSWFPKRSIVAPYDFSAESWAAVELALSLVEHPSGLVIVHVVPVDVVGDPKAPMREQVPEKLAERFSEPRFRESQLKVAYGDPGSEIASLAEQLGADLIVIPSHGRHGIRRVLIGSVAERVTRMAHCPVLVLRK